MTHNCKPVTHIPVRSGHTDFPAPQQVDVRELLGDGRELRILHGNQEYRLTLTRKGKLILTK